jgi:lipopolysaccharide transport system ATP-binding protein
MSSGLIRNLIEPVAVFENVALEIPVHTSSLRTLKRSLLSGLTGGQLARSGRSLRVRALDGLCISINHGDRIALIGHNGAGKSTFLRVLSGILIPTSGKWQLPKPFTPLIDKSFVVEPQLSGFQAAKAHYLLHTNTLSGFDAFLKDVSEFSELEDFLHLPLQGYSDGMKTRLLFAMHTYFSHDLLALDEGIGAGDRAFVDRAARRLKHFLSSSGTLVIASHSEPMLRAFCTKGVVFAKGNIKFEGGINEALSYYQQSLITS